MQLLGEFWGLIRPHRATIYVALATLSVSTLLGLAPLYGTKIVFDNILGDRPLPQRLTRIVALPADRVPTAGRRGRSDGRAGRGVRIGQPVVEVELDAGDCSLFAYRSASRSSTMPCGCRCIASTI